MTYTVNGTTHDTGPVTVADLVSGLVEAETGVAVAVNGAVVPRSQWDRSVADGDVVDILTAVQGG